MTTSPNRTLLCVGNFDRRTGYAWNTIRNVWRSVAAALAPRGVRTLAVYRQPAVGDGLSGEPPLEEIAAGWNTADDLRALCRSHAVDGCWLTDTPVLDRDYGRLRAAGVGFIAVHQRTSGDRAVPGGLKRTLKSFLAGRPSWSADRYIAISDFVRQRLLASGCVPPEKVTRIYNAIDLERWSELEPAADARRRLGLDPVARWIVTTCRANHYKGVDTLIDAVALLPETDRDGTPIRAAYCGDGPDLDAFRERVTAAGLNDRVHIEGSSDDVRTWIAAADLVVVPSRWQEAFGLAVVEGLAARRPVIATTAGAIPELIEHGRTGMLVPPGDPAALGEAIRACLDDAPMASGLARAGHEEAHRRFGFERLTAELTELFSTGLEGR